MSQEKTLITNAQKPAKFLGYEVLVRKTDVTKRNKFNVPVRSFNGTVVLKVATETVKNRLEHYEAIKYKMENGVQTWFPKLRGKLMKKKIEDIVARYNSEIRRFYNYYSIANNVSYAASKFGYIMEYSMYHTIAAKQTVQSVRSLTNTKKEMTSLFRITMQKVNYVTEYSTMKVSNANCHRLSQMWTISHI